MATPLVPFLTPQALANPLVQVTRVGATGDVYRCLVAGKQVFQGTQQKAKQEESAWQTALANETTKVITAEAAKLAPLSNTGALAIMVLEGK
jgi:hypothetical protein